MSSTLLINAAGRETRVALVEGGHISEFYLERKKDKGIVGNIYRGRVVRVLPGMQAAFVDIGEEKSAFLYVGDVVYDPDFAREQFELTEGEHEDAPEVPELVEAELSDSTAGHVETEPPVEAAAPEGEHADEAKAETAAEEAPDAALEDAHHPEAEVTELAPGELAPPPPHDEATSSEAPSSLLESSPPAEGEAKPAEAAEAATALEGTGTGAEPAATPTPVATPSPIGAPSSKGEVRAPRQAKERRRDEPRKREERGRGRHEERQAPRKQARIEDVVKVGQEVIVQVSKDPIGTKGARLTSHISIPGRHLVFMPTVDHIGISRRISSEKERRRLRETVDRMRPPGTGFIVRTVAENVPQEKLESDIRFLIEVWNQVVRRREKGGGPGLMHPDLDLILRATRDLFAHDVEKLIVDDREEYERVLGFVTAQDPALKDRVVLHDSDEPIFDAYGIEHEINRALNRKVWLKSGGYLIIDQAEALTAIDVNSGRYVGKKSLEETITKINMEAAKEIVYQLRLRNIGGIIICDFIDMEKQQNREKVFKTLQEALGRDKAKTNVLRISELGLIEMTRKRVRESIGRVMHEDCAYCGGQGFVKTPTTVCYEIFREIRREGMAYREPTLVVNCSPDVAKLFQTEEREELRHLMDRFNKTIQIKAQPNYHREQYDVYGRTAQGADHVLAKSAPRHAEEAPPLAEKPEPRGGGGSRHEQRRREGRERDNRDRDNRDRGDRDRDRGRGGGGGRDRDRGNREERQGQGRPSQEGGRDGDKREEPRQQQENRGSSVPPAEPPAKTSAGS
jgi:ribonuclease G